MIRRNSFLLLILVIFPLLTWALANDDQQIMHIIADKSLFNYKTGINTYQGHVHVDQGASHLVANRVITYTDQNHQIFRVEAYGDNAWAQYSTLPNAQAKLLVATAKIITFYPQKSLVVLKDQVIVTQGGNNFQGPLVFYNIINETVTSPPVKGQHSTIIIEPGK